MADTIRDAVDRIMSGDWVFTGTVTLPALCVDEDNLTTAALLPASKLVTRFPAYAAQADGTDVAAQTDVIHVAKFAGIVTSVEAVCSTAPTGGDKKLTIDVQKATAGGAWATILSATFDIDNAEADRVATAGTLDAAKDDYVAGDIFQVVVTISGSTGAHGQGLNVTVFFQESPTS